MSVFGGDSWARDAQQRKRRLDDLMLPASASSSPSTLDSFRRLPNGKLACLVCPNRPVLDSPLMLSVQGKLLSDWQTEVLKRQEQELRFTASGWKRDGHGTWYRDENVEFDSDEDDPNTCLC
ncbi:unnamed protein product [Urochloa humidicola]